MDLQVDYHGILGPKADMGDEIPLHVSEFKYLGCVLDKSGTHGAECSRKVVSRRRVAGAIRSLVNGKDL